MQIYFLVGSYLDSEPTSTQVNMMKLPHIKAGGKH